MTRQFYQTSSTGESTTTSSSYQDKATLTFTPDASSTYLIIATWLYQKQQSTISPCTAQLYDATGSASLSEQIYYPRDATDYMPGGCAVTAAFGSSPSSQTYKIQYKSDGTYNGAIKQARIIAIKLTANDQTASSTGRVTYSTNTTWQDKVSKTFTATAGYYLIIASAVMDHDSTTYSARAQIDVDGSAQYGSSSVYVNNTNNRFGYLYFQKVSLTAASHTVKLQYATGSEGCAVGIASAYLTILALSDFDAVISAEQDTAQVDTDGTQDHALTADFSGAPTVDHIILACGFQSSSSAYSPSTVGLYEGTTDLGSTLIEPQNTASRHPYAGIYFTADPADTYYVDVLAKSGNYDATVDDIRIYGLQLESAVTSVSASDTLLLKLGTGSSLAPAATIPGTDALLITMGAETGGIAATLAASDTLLMKHTPESGISPTAAIVGIDTFLLKYASDPAILLGSLTGQDTLHLLFGESATAELPVERSALDTLLISFIESSSIGFQRQATDALLFNLENELSHAPEATVSGSDTLVINPVISSPLWTFPHAEDTLLLGLYAETRAYEGQLTKQVADTLTLRWAIEVGSISYSPISQDTFIITLGETGDWLDFWRACNLPRRRIYGKAEISFSDPFVADSNIEITAPACSYPSTEASLIDGRDKVPGKWFTFGNNLLDGNSILCPKVGDDFADYTTGWWSDAVSDENGSFSPPIVITLEFPARPVYEVKMIGDPNLGGLPEDFTIEIYAGTTLLNDPGEQVVGNTNYNWTKTISPVYFDVTKIVYTITKINDPLAQCRILELFSAYKEDYDENDIKSIEVLEELEYESGTVPIGNISSNEIVLTLSNPNRRFDPSNPVSPIRNLMMKHRRIKAWLGVYLSPTTGIIWQPMGVFYSMDWSAPDDSLFVEVMGLDRLEILRNTDFAPQNIYVDYTIGDILEDVFEQAGVMSNEYIIDSALYGTNYKIPYAWFDRTSSRYAIQKLAENALAYVYCDRDGKINVRLYSSGTTPVIEFNRDNYYSRDHPLRWSEMVNSLEVIATPRAPGDPDTEVYRDNETFAVPAGETVERFYMFNQTPVYGDITTTITADKTGLTTEATTYPWSIRIWYTNPTEETITISGVVHTGSPLVETGGLVVERSNQDSINQNGRVALSSPIKLEFIQTRAQATRIAEGLIGMYSDPQRDVELYTRGYLTTMIGDRVGVSNYQDDPAEDYNIVRQEIEWSGPLRVKVTARKVIEEE